MSIRSSRAITALLLILSATAVSAQVGKSVTVKEANTASEAEMASMPHMTAALAKEVVAARPFLTASAFDAFLDGKLSKEQRAALYPRLFVHINLNTATREEIMLVPGMGPRFLREFLEYRPYKSLAQFRREMGKYVSDKEVARLERYIVIP